MSFRRARTPKLAVRGTGIKISQRDADMTVREGVTDRHRGNFMVVMGYGGDSLGQSTIAV